MGKPDAQTFVEPASLEEAVRRRDELASRVAEIQTQLSTAKEKYANAKGDPDFDNEAYADWRHRTLRAREWAVSESRFLKSWIAGQGRSPEENLNYDNEHSIYEVVLHVLAIVKEFAPWGRLSEGEQQAIRTATHWARKRYSEAERQHRLAVLGLCRKCGKEPRQKERAYCAKCAAYYRKRATA